MYKNKILNFVLTIGLLLSSMQFSPVRAASLQENRIPPAPASLDEVFEYYGRLGDIQGMVGVVVELSNRPAVVVYTKAKDTLHTPESLSAITKSQIDLIQQEQDTFSRALKDRNIDVTELFRTQRVYNGIYLYVDASELPELAKVPGVKALHPLIPKEIEHTTSVPLIGALQVWAGTSAYQGDGIKIGVIDTGIDYIHNDFGGGADYTGQDFTTLDESGNLFPTAKVVGGWDFAGDDYDAGGTGSALVPVPDPDPMDCNGHGTHVAGTAAGFGVLPGGDTYTESGSDTYANLVTLSENDYISKFSIAPGVAPKASLYALRVFGCSGSTNLTDQAIEWAMDPNNDNDFSDHLDVINMSLGSSFGSENDTTAVASNNAAQAGVIVVTSAGNGYDVYYVAGSPGVAQRAISVANTQDKGAVVSAFELISTSGTMAPGLYQAVEAGFGPTTFNLTGELAYGAPTNGCGSSPISGVSGKIALIDRGTCTFATKYQNAVNGGATGVLVANHVDGWPFAMGGSPTGSVTAPAMMTTLAVGNQLKADLGSGAVTVRLTSEYHNQYVALEPSLEDTISSSSSRGIARVTNLLKPDIAAPGDTIFSAATGTGNQGVSYSGTSMSSPHVAGVMAILRQQHPSWAVEQLKALVMNTATNDVLAGANKHTPSRVGAGRVSVLNATQSDVISYNTDNPEIVSVPFGVVKVEDTTTGVDQTLTKSIAVENKGASSQTYNVTFDSRYPSNSGITFSLLDASDNPLSSVTVAAGGTETIKVKVDLDAALLDKTIDPTVSVGDRSTMGEAGGYVVLTSTGSQPQLRVPVHIAARAAANMKVTETVLNMSGASGTLHLTPSGTPVDLTNDYSLAYILELLGEEPALTGLAYPSMASADLHHIGAMSDYPTNAWDNSNVYFGFSTYADWDTLHSVEFDIYVDTNEDNVDDYVIYNYDTGSSSRNDTLVTVVFDLHTYTDVYSDYINLYGGSVNTNVFNNNVLVMPVFLTDLGLDESANTDFNFYVVTYHRDSPTGNYVDRSAVYSYDVKNKVFDSTHPSYKNPLWNDDSTYSPTFDITYDNTYLNSTTQGLLLLHLHNKTNTAEVVPVGAIPDPWVGGVSIESDQNIVAVARPHVGSQVASYIASGAGSTTQYVPMLFKDAFGGAYDAALYIQNQGDVSATLSIEFRKDDGAVVYTLNDTLDAKASKGYWLPSIAGLGTSFVGGAKVTSNQPVLAVGRPHISGEVMTYNGVAAGSTTAWLPMFFKDGYGSYNAALYVQNLTGSSATLTIEYLNLDGTVACTDNDTLDANASKGYWSKQVTCDTGSLPAGFVGSVKVTSTKNILTVARPHLGTQITTYNGFAGGAATAYVPMLFRKAFGGSYNAALYLQNVSDSSADVTIDYVDNAGIVKATQTVTNLDAGAITNVWLPLVAGLPDGFVGGARITATQEVIAVGRPHLDSEITAYNGAAAGSLNAFLPMLFKNAFGGDYNSAFYIQNVTANAATVNISFYDDAGALSCIKTVTLDANATTGFWLPSTICTP